MLALSVSGAAAVTDAWLLALADACPALESLRIFRCGVVRPDGPRGEVRRGVTDAACPAFERARLPRLRVLLLHSTGITAAGVATLAATSAVACLSLPLADVPERQCPDGWSCHLGDVTIDGCQVGEWRRGDSPQ